ncbi:acyltransferase family protein [Enterobacter sp. CP102]|uniref:acyltransferase family protein n=1 Tax=Enterobacter sp. CP102 TaxID=2976431 RepID=UPI0038FC683F
MLVEVWVNNVLFNADINERQFPLFCVPVSIFLLALSVNITVKDNIISRLGRDYSLGVYLIHPFILYYLGKDVGGVVGNSGFLKLFVSFSSSIVILYVLKKFIPVAYNKLNGVYVK